VDFLRDRLDARRRAWIELYGLLLLLLPFVALVVISSGPFVAQAWRSDEVSASAGGLPARWIIKSVLPAAMVLVGVAALARIVRVGRLLFGASVQRPAREDG
jgi:TRAP-type mannitol/chloroaromatic compound transport system permease small subunit